MDDTSQITVSVTGAQQITLFVSSPGEQTPTRVCTKCGAELPATTEFFHKSPLGKYALSSVCKTCQHAYQKIHDKEYNRLQREERNAKQRAKRKADPEAARAKGREYYWAHAEEIRAKWRENAKKNRERNRKRDKQRAKVNAERRRTLQLDLPASFTKDDWMECLKYFHNSCAYCGAKKDLTQDHFVPLTSGGGLVPDNVVPACRRCNSSKNNHTFRQWYPAQTFYSYERERAIRAYFKKKRSEFLSSSE